MLNVAAVQVENYCGRGAEYVAKLFDGIRRHMPKGVVYRMVCFTDGSAPLPNDVEARGLPTAIKGWWNKIALFRDGAFVPGERVLLFDLDTIILDDLSDIASYDGRFAALHDFFEPKHLGSACMAWEAGTIDHVWRVWDGGGRPQFDKRGDQFWIETVLTGVDYWQEMLPGQFVSFKADCFMPGKIPAEARVLGFHGHPRPHECRAPYVKELWDRPLLSAAA